jgi:hypothetical protein
VSHAYPVQVDHCECTWKHHEGVPCPNPPLEEPGLVIMPSLCVSCLHVCEGEREDEMECL